MQARLDPWLKLRLMTRTRLSRRLEKKSRKNFLLKLFGIFIILFILVKYGIPLLANFSLFISQIGKKDELSNSKQNTYISSPILNPLPTATNSAKIVISGSASKSQEIFLYINNELLDKQQADEKGTFSFSEELNNGNNEIKVRAKQNNAESDFSEADNIVYLNKSPQLTIDTPTDGQKFLKGDENIQVTGKTDPNTSVTINGFFATIDENNQYAYTLNLKSGDNNIQIVAVDNAGNKTEKSIKINYSP
jgi:hypothetical protein